MPCSPVNIYLHFGGTFRLDEAGDCGYFRNVPKDLQVYTESQGKGDLHIHLN
jgi:hypothetical protein